MIVDINGKRYKVGLWEAAYFLVAAIFVIYVGTGLAYNSAFVDEAIYATVGESVLRGIFWESALSWMGGSYLYPLISALVNRSFGLYGIRLFSVFCLVVAGLVAGSIAGTIGGRAAKVFAIAIFLSSVGVLSVASLGTYDAPALLFMALSLWAAVASQNMRPRKRALVIGASSLLFLFSVLTKYISIILLPFVALSILGKGEGKHLSRLLLWSLPFGILFSIYGFMNYASLVSFFTGGVYTDTKERWFIFTEIIKDLNIFVLGAASLPYFFMRKKVKLHLALILFFAGLMPLAYHLGSANYRSLWKHLVATQFFWAPLVAVVLVKAYIWLRKKVNINTYFTNASQLVYSSIMVIALFALWHNFSQYWRFQRSWPSVTPIVDYLVVERRPSDKVLAEGGSVFKYHLFDGFADPFSWTSTWYAEYDGLYGVEAMKRAIDEEFYDIIILNGYYTFETSAELMPLVDAKYEKVLTHYYAVSGEYDLPTFVWLKKGR